MGSYYGYGAYDSWSLRDYLPKAFYLDVKKDHKRLIFSIVALYLCYRLSCWIFRLFFGPKNTRSVSVRRSSRIVRLIESVLIVSFGLGIGAVAYYAHQKQSSEMLQSLADWYGYIVRSIVLHSTGFDISRSSLNPNETLLVGSVLSAGVIAFLVSIVRFLLRHYIFGSSMVMLGAVLSVYRFPITANTANNYTGSMFLIDRASLTASFEPTLIPKIILVLTIVYYLFIVLLKGFTLFLKVSFRLLLCSLIVTILLNTIMSLVQEDASMPDIETRTTFIPNHQF